MIFNHIDRINHINQVSGTEPRTDWNYIHEYNFFTMNVTWNITNHVHNSWKVLPVQGFFVFFHGFYTFEDFFHCFRFLKILTGFLKVLVLLIHSANPQSHGTHHCFCTCRPSFQNNVGPGETVGLAKWIIDDPCLVKKLFLIVTQIHTYICINALTVAYLQGKCFTCPS